MTDSPVQQATEAAAVSAVSLTAAPLDPRHLEALVRRPGAGALATFAGVVRDENLGRRVRYLEYEGHPEMALSAMAAIKVEIETRWPGARAAMAHRLGRLEIGDVSVVVVVSHPHRAEAFEACRHGIDTLKVTVPIWKKEYFLDGSHWVEGVAPHPM